MRSISAVVELLVSYVESFKLRSQFVMFKICYVSLYLFELLFQLMLKM